MYTIIIHKLLKQLLYRICFITSSPPKKLREPKIKFIFLGGHEKLLCVSKLTRPSGTDLYVNVGNDVKMNRDRSKGDP